MPSDPAREAVALGAARLDREHRRWAYRVDKGRIDSASITDCVLVQVFGDYAKGAMTLFAGSPEELRKHGFAAIWGVSWHRLDEAWGEVIDVRTKGVDRG